MIALGVSSCTSVTGRWRGVIQSQWIMWPEMSSTRCFGDGKLLLSRWLSCFFSLFCCELVSLAMCARRQRKQEYNNESIKMLVCICLKQKLKASLQISVAYYNKQVCLLWVTIKNNWAVFWSFPCPSVTCPAEAFGWVGWLGAETTSETNTPGLLLLSELPLVCFLKFRGCCGSIML